jgi:hypothetical protein
LTNGGRQWLFVACTVVLAAALAPRAAQAYRPFDGTDADVAKPGEFELELGPVHFYREDGSNFLVAPATVLNLGLADRLELVADFKNFVSLDEPEANAHRLRLRDTDLLAKMVLCKGALQERSGPSVALEAGVLLPEPGASDGFGTQANVIVSFASTSVAVHLNEAIALNRDHRFEDFTGAIVEVGRTLVVRPVAEVFADHAVGGGSEYSVLAGALWAASETWVLDAALRAARSDGASVFELRLGVTWTARVWNVQASE